MPRARGGIEYTDITFALNHPIADHWQHAVLAKVRNADVDRTIINDAVAASIQKPLTGAWPEQSNSRSLLNTGCYARRRLREKVGGNRAVSGQIYSQGGRLAETAAAPTGEDRAGGRGRVESH